MDQLTQIRTGIDRIKNCGYIVRVIRISEEVNESILIKTYLESAPPVLMKIDPEEAYKIALQKTKGKKLMQLFGYPVEVSKGLINWTFSVNQRNYNTL